jgi:PPOX class probable F420-dependent enzyme
MSLLNDLAREAIAAGPLAHVVTLGRSGTPHVTIVWIGLDGDELVCAHLADYQKVRNIRRDPRVAVSMVTGGKNQIGLDNYLVINGRARITEGGAADLLQRLAETYIGPGVKFPPMDDPPAGYVTHIAVERVSGIGPWSQGEG